MVLINFNTTIFFNHKAKIQNIWDQVKIKQRGLCEKNKTECHLKPAHDGKIKMYKIPDN